MSTKLTKREAEILGIVSQGYRTKEIANLLFISIATVEKHRKNIIKKLEVKNMIGAITKTHQIQNFV